MPRLGSCAAANKERAALATELSNKRFERNAKQLGGVLAPRRRRSAAHGRLSPWPKFGAFAVIRRSS